MAAALDERRLVPELLDGLPASDPRAMGSRGDLRRVNALMFNAAIMASRLRRDVSAPPRRWLEIGCGDGTFLLGLARKLAPRWPGVQVVLVDRQDLVTTERLKAFRLLGWQAEAVVADAIGWLEAEREGYDLVTANLFVHHFAGEELVRLLAAVHRLGRQFVATEPRRGGLALAGSSLLGLIGANSVTRHDAMASVRAGFAGRELSAAWPGSIVVERAVGPFTHVFSARGAER